MPQSEEYVALEVPREGVNDSFVRVLEWLVAEGAPVDVDQPVAVLETTKVTFELQASQAGYLFRLAGVGDEVPVGNAVALVAKSPSRPDYRPTPAASTPEPSDQIITKKARALIEQHNLSVALFAGLPVVRTEDVEAVVRSGHGAEPAQRIFKGELLDPSADWDAATDTELRRELTALLISLRKRMKAKHDRHVATGDLLTDRWELARELGFGEGTSVYDNCLVLGDVRVGKHCWVGPDTILDGQGGLVIGDYVDIGAGVHVYTHHTIERALTGHKASMFKRPSSIGNCCFIAPKATIAPGTVLGDHTFVAAASYVEGSFPAYSYLAGNPARRVGVVEVSDARARVKPLEEDA
jgi:acetyltransferase-like isoleucine patch superfamily enzyme